LYDQINENFILNKKKNELGDDGTYRLVLNADLEGQYIKKSLPTLFILKDIKVWNKELKSYAFIELHIMQGILAGFRVGTDYDNLDLENIEISSIKEKHFDDSSKNRIRDLIENMPQHIVDKLDIDSSFTIDLDSKEYYVIKDYKDGNYLSMDNEKHIYSMIHDPYSVRKLYESLDQFTAAIDSGSFSIED